MCGRLSFESAVCCQTEFTAKVYSLFQMCRTVCGVSEYDREASIIIRPWPTGRRCGMEENLATVYCWPGSPVGVVTELRDGRSRIESRWRRDFPPVQTGPGAHPASCKMGTGSFSGVKCVRGVLLTTHPPSSAAVMEE